MWTELNRRCDTDMGDHEDVELNPCQIDYDGPYAEQFRQLLQMLSAAAAKSGYRTESYDASDDLDSL